MTTNEFAKMLKKADTKDIETIINICEAELNSRKSTKKSTKVTKSEPNTEVKKQEGHYILKGNDLWIIYKDPKESGSYQFNRVSKAIKLSATKDFGAKWSGDYDKAIWKWTFKSADDRKAFQQAQKERG